MSRDFCRQQSCFGSSLPLGTTHLHTNDPSSGALSAVVANEGIPYRTISINCFRFCIHALEAMCDP